MPVISPLDVVLINVIGRLSGQTIITTFPQIVDEVTGTPDQYSTFLALDTSFKATDGFLRDLQNVLPHDYDFVETRYQVIRDTRWAAFRFAWNSQSGGLEEFAETANLSFAITRRGDLGNRKNVGGIRLPLAQGDGIYQDGLLTDAFKVIVAPLLLELAASRTANGVKFVPILMNNDGTAPIPVTSAFTENNVRAMARRVVGRGI